MPNTFAYIVLISWPFISLLFYKQLPIVHATFWTIVGGFLLLPVKTEIDFPLIPPLDKELIPAIFALIGCKYIKRVRISLLPKNGIERWFVLAFIFIPLFTMFNNQEVFNYIPGLTIHDTISAMLNQYIKILPFILGAQIIKTHDDQVLLFKLLVKAGLLYSLLILFEIRMSPQLHTWVYGFFPHDFGQQMRSGGFRPVVFLGHGLLVSMFVTIVLAGAVILLKERIKSYGLSPWLFVLYFGVILFLSKSLGAIIFGTVLFLSIKWLSTEMNKKIIFFLMFVFFLYPLLSVFDLFPHELLIQLAGDFDSDRARSISFRFYHENLLLEHAQRKPFFGWGSWGRNRLEGSVTDGHWIIIYGTYGLIGFLSFFCLPAISVYKAIKFGKLIKNKDEQKVLISFALIISIVIIDQILNASLTAFLMFLSGALLGRANSIKFEKLK